MSLQYFLLDPTFLPSHFLLSLCLCPCLYLKTFLVCVDQLFLYRDPVLECGWCAKWSHIEGNWIFLCQQLSSANSSSSRGGTLRLWSYYLVLSNPKYLTLCMLSCCGSLCQLSWCCEVHVVWCLGEWELLLDICRLPHPVLVTPCVRLDTPVVPKWVNWTSLQQYNPQPSRQWPSNIGLLSHHFLGFPFIWPQ